MLKPEEREEIELIIQSVLKRFDHTSSSPQTLRIIGELTKKFEAHLREHTENSKRLDDRFDPESDKYILKDIKPVIEAYRGSKILGEFLKWAAGIFIAYTALMNFFKS